MILSAPVSCKRSRSAWVICVRTSRHKGRTKTRMGPSACALQPSLVRLYPWVRPGSIRLAARYTPPWKRCGATKPCRPIARHPPFGQRQHARADLGLVPAGQYEEAAVVGDLVQSAILRTKVPADPTIPDAALQRRRREVQLGHPLLAPSCDVPCGLTNCGQCPKISDAATSTPVIGLPRLVRPGGPGFPSNKFILGILGNVGCPCLSR